MCFARLRLEGETARDTSPPIPRRLEAIRPPGLEGVDLTCTIRRSLEDHHLQGGDDAGGGKLHGGHGGIETYLLNEKNIYNPTWNNIFSVVAGTPWIPLRFFGV